VGAVDGVALAEDSGDKYPGGGPPYFGAGAVEGSMGFGSDGAALASSAGVLVEDRRCESSGGGPPYFAASEKTSHPASAIAELSATAASFELVRVVRQNGQMTSAARR